MKYIAVFCSAMDLDKKYTQPAKEFGKLMAKQGYSLVWGGNDKGLMKIIADVVQENGGKLVGVNLDVFKKFARKHVDEMIVAKTLGERKATMLKRAEAIVILIGGIGTLDEATEVIELRKQGAHDKPIIILNTENFYDGLKMQLEKMRDDGFFQIDINYLVYFANTPEEAMEYINKNLG